MKQQELINEECIYAAVAQEFKLDAGELTQRHARRNARVLSEARQVAAYLLRVHTDSHLRDIAEALDMKDRQYAMYCVKKIIMLLGQNIDYRIMIARIELKMLEMSKGR